MRHNCRQKIRHENVCNLSRSKPNAHTHTLNLHTLLRVCVCKHCALGSFGPGWERRGRGLANCCNARGNIAVIVCTCQRGFPFSIFHSTCRRSAFYSLYAGFFLIARIFAFCILHELNSAQLWAERVVETGTGGQHVAVECADIWRQLLWH